MKLGLGSQGKLDSRSSFSRIPRQVPVLATNRSANNAQLLQQVQQASSNPHTRRVSSRFGASYPSRVNQSRRRRCVQQRGFTQADTAFGVGSGTHVTTWHRSSRFVFAGPNRVQERGDTHTSATCRPGVARANGSETPLVAHVRTTCMSRRVFIIPRSRVRVRPPLPFKTALVLSPGRFSCALFDGD